MTTCFWVIEHAGKPARHSNEFDHTEYAKDVRAEDYLRSVKPTFLDAMQMLDKTVVDVHGFVKVTE